ELAADHKGLRAVGLAKSEDRSRPLGLLDRVIDGNRGQLRIATENVPTTQRKDHQISGFNPNGRLAIKNDKSRATLNDMETRRRAAKTETEGHGKIVGTHRLAAHPDK